MRGLPIMVVCLTAACISSAFAQEYLDTAGRWKHLMLPGGNLGSGYVPRAMAANNGRVVIARESRRMVVSADSGETWRNADDGLPSGVATVWAMTFPEPAAAPLRLLAVASTAGLPVQAVLLESTDGGLTWRNTSRLPDLDVLFAAGVDTMRLYGPPLLQFLPRTAGVLRGFLSSAVGLLGSDDGGLTWGKRGDGVAIRSLEMADDQNGVAALGQRGASGIYASSGGLYWTSDGGTTWNPSYPFEDGGFFQWIVIESWGSSVYRVFAPYRFQNYLDWRLLRSSDGGRTWGVRLGRQARRPVYGFAFFRDTTDVHVVGDGAILSHSADGGDLFYVLRDTTRYYWQTPLDDIPGYVTKAPVAARDNRFIYLTVPGNRAARWRMAGVEPLSSVRGNGDEASVSIIPNPTADGRALLSFGGSASSWEVRVCDPVGRTVFHRSGTASGIHPIRLDFGGIAPGLYVAAVVVDGRRRSISLLVLQ